MQMMFLSPYETIYPYLSMRFHFLTPLSGIRYRLMLTSDATTWSTYVKYRIHQFTLTRTQMNANILYRRTDHHHLVGKSSWKNWEVGKFENSNWHRKECSKKYRAEVGKINCNCQLNELPTSTKTNRFQWDISNFKKLFNYTFCSSI